MRASQPQACWKSKAAPAPATPGRKEGARGMGMHRVKGCILIRVKIGGLSSLVGMRDPAILQSTQYPLYINMSHYA